MAKSDEKQYGLILPKKQLAPALQSNVFGDDNASDEDEGTDWVKKALKAESEKNKKKKQTRLDMQKALDEDPTIYQYDEVYDDMERTKIEQKIIKTEIKKPKYIHNLLKTAERRKREQEHRVERMVQKEREAEGEMYADKESFVTSAYRAKLEEFKKMEEEEARMDRLESIADVTKQQDMSGFYRHLFHQTIDNVEQNTEKKDTLSIINKSDEETSNETKLKNINKVKKIRQYRQRNMEEGSDSETDLIKEKVENSEQKKEDELSEPKKKKLKESEGTSINESISVKALEVKEKISKKKEQEYAQNQDVSEKETHSDNKTETLNENTKKNDDDVLSE